MKKNSRSIRSKTNNFASSSHLNLEQYLIEANSYQINALTAIINTTKNG